MLLHKFFSTISFYVVELIRRRVTSRGRIAFIAKFWKLCFQNVTFFKKDRRSTGTTVQ